jgi:tRNA A37 N6-isopentenylltransferase MiaA
MGLPSTWLDTSDLINTEFNRLFSDVYTRLWNSMISSGFVDSIETGVNRVLNKSNTIRYAFFIDYARGKYIESKNCELTTLETQFAQKSYSFGFPRGSKLREKFTEM